ncbi:hypothetical protein L228DRAFT_215302 [Xylona heveae TC161]|uniref:Translocation protein sec72 n=1 Tax=Xylona heveae (strain CBS 132557 / TC161) TaxID=1328760 RepID=A0A164ZHI1_XYLHT|nr:hypothetical protein L228DRAFT_215302 [Xylona heveae TC161]KZF19111.1 hypothetical protein L228DRAFT_215302 [Xylona heveae TC161]
MDETFTLLPLHLDPSSKAISTSSTSSTSSSSALTTELATLNALHRTLLSLETPGKTPPPPIPVNPKRSAAITKMRENGNAHFRKGAHAEAVRLYTFAIDMALGRPVWEPAGLVREEVAGLFANRAAAQMGLRNFPEAAVDAETSVEMKRIGNAKAWWRRGKCLVEMGRLRESKDWLGKALEVEGKEAEIVGLLAEVKKELERRGE